MKFDKYFSKNKTKYKKVNVKILHTDGSVIFQQEGVTVPIGFSDGAAGILASSYFRHCEHSIEQVSHRISETIKGEGLFRGYFHNVESAEAFACELTWLLENQYCAFNSPVWFNCGLWHQYGLKGSVGQFAWDYDCNTAMEIQNSYKRPQVSACFIQSVEDDLMSIFDLAKNEAKVFKHGSGSGTNYSALRGKGEALSGGGSSSGVMSFLKMLDSAAGATKSGGKNRRSARLNALNVDHPEIEEFITWKSLEESKVRALTASGYDSSWQGEAYRSVSGQNGNNSVRVTDKFMAAVIDGSDWKLVNRTYCKVCRTIPATYLWEKICKAAWEVGDPGIQFHDTINKWNTLASVEPINASNPCCFVRDTLVETSIGPIPIGSLACMPDDKLPYAITYDIDTDMRVRKRILKAWCSGQTKELIEVTTSQGLVARCTPEHKWLTTDSQYISGQMLSIYPSVDIYIAAKHLSIGTELRSSSHVDNTVISIKKIVLDEPVDVYDIEVQHTHNFSVMDVNQITSVIVANSEYHGFK